MRPRRSHWSGLDIRCWHSGEMRGWLQVDIWRLSMRGVERVRSVKVPLAATDDAEACPVFWAPIVTKPGVCLVTVRQTTESGTRLRSGPFVFSWKRSTIEPIYSQPAADVPLPVGLLFSPVTQCNLNCIHCISRHSRDEMSQFSDLAWRKIEDAVASGRLIHLRADYSGDLLFADRRHGDWLRRIEELGVGFAIDTHANDLTDDYVDRLLRSRLTSINFSLDSMDADDYPRIRRGARPLREVIAKIERFMAARHARRPDVETILSFVLMRRNLDSMRAAIDLAATLGIDKLIGNHLHAYTSDMADASLMLEPGRYRRTYDDLTAYARLRGVNLGLPAPVRSRTSRRGHRPCSYPWATMAVLGNGDVMACCVPGTRVGNLNDSGLEQIWNGDAMQRFRVRVNSNDPPEVCTVCPMLRLPNNFASYVPGLPEHERQAFERRCRDAEARAGG
jgi:radical SAM protein with 4Fe4S-binding SPASM domain